MSLTKVESTYIEEILGQAYASSAIYELLNRVTIEKCFLVKTEHQKCGKWKSLNSIESCRDAYYVVLRYGNILNDGYEYGRIMIEKIKASKTAFEMENLDN